jgi:hypothetical protein
MCDFIIQEVAAYKGHSVKFNYLTFNFTDTEAFGHFYLQAMLTLDRFIYTFKFISHYGCLSAEFCAHFMDGRGR